MPVFRRCFMVVRRTTDSGKEWLDIDSISLTREGARNTAARSVERIPDWDKANPVVRVVKVRIEEIEEPYAGPVPS
jgi:hypothetical protein